MLYESPHENTDLGLPFNSRVLKKPLDPKKVMSNCPQCGIDNMEQIAKRLGKGTADTETAPKNAIGNLPRIVLEQAADGSITIEHYINGARQRVAVAEGMLAWEIQGAFAEQRNSLMAQAERAEVKRQEEIKNRHNKVYKWTAESHSIAFANRTVNGLNSGKNRARVNQAPTVPVANLDDLI